VEGFSWLADWLAFANTCAQIVLEENSSWLNSDLMT